MIIIHPRYLSLFFLFYLYRNDILKPLYFLEIISMGYLVFILNGVVNDNGETINYGRLNCWYG